MKTIFCLFILIFLYVSFAQSQGLYNKGAKISVASTNYLIINNGDFVNSTSTTDGTVNLSGNLKLDGDWINNSSNILTLSGGTVTFIGSSQDISGTSYTEFYNLTIASGASAQVPADHFLTVTNNLTMTGDLTLISQSSSYGNSTASLIDGGSSGTNTGDITVQLYLTGGDLNHFVSSPVNAGAFSSLFVASNGGYNIYWYNENQSSKAANDRWERMLTSPLVNARGYSVVYTDPTTRVFSGTLATSSDITISITKAGSTANDGWNMIGNPYTSPISCTSFVSNNSDITGTLYFWDDPGSNYSTGDFAQWNSIGNTSASNNSHSPTDYIPIGQAFFVEKTAIGSSTVSFKNSQRIHKTSSDMYFFTSEPKSFPRLKMSVENEDGNYNEILIGFPEDATNGIDRLYDGKKLKGNENLSFYCIQNDEKYSILGFAPLNEQELIIPLGIENGYETQYTLKPKFIENFDSKIYFEDKLMNYKKEITENFEYQFTIKEGITDNRFFISFNPNSNEVADTKPINSFMVYQNSNGIIINNIANDEYTFYLFDVSGKLIQTKVCFGSTSITDLSKGIYIIKIQSESQFLTEKIIIQ